MNFVILVIVIKNEKGGALITAQLVPIKEEQWKYQKNENVPNAVRQSH